MNAIVNRDELCSRLFELAQDCEDYASTPLLPKGEVRRFRTIAAYLSRFYFYHHVRPKDDLLEQQLRLSGGQASQNKAFPSIQYACTGKRPAE
jgi:hypothetical protein